MPDIAYAIRPAGNPEAGPARLEGARAAAWPSALGLGLWGEVMHRAEGNAPKRSRTDCQEIGRNASLSRRGRLGPTQPNAFHFRNP